MTCAYGVSSFSVNNQIKDEEMNKKRKDFFNPFDKYDNRIF